MNTNLFRFSVSRVSLLTSQVLHLQKYNQCISFSSFKYDDLEIQLINSAKKQHVPSSKPLAFGKTFSTHMLEVEWSDDKGWSYPRISPIHDLVFHPACKVLHYAQELFEGLKAYRSKEGKILLFRPELNVERMLITAERASLPLFDGEEFLRCLKKLISIDKEWVPHDENYSLYIRPTLIGTEPALGITSSKRALLYVITGPVGAYYPTGTETPVSLLADPKYVRSWPGGVGDKKMGCNYAPTIYIQKRAESQGHQQVLWLFGDDHKLVEVGTMNIFIFLKNSETDYELVTPPLDGLILPGVTRQSILDLAREWNEFKVTERYITMKEIVEAYEKKKLLEIFGCGTACVVSPVGSITYLQRTLNIPTTNSPIQLYQRFYKTLKNIQYGRTSSKWSVLVE